jgi:hypothetical protein
MYTLVRTVARRDLVVRHAPALGASLVMAALFHAFHSFPLECVAFLATWYALDWAAHAVVRGREPR